MPFMSTKRLSRRILFMAAGTALWWALGRQPVCAQIITRTKTEPTWTVEVHVGGVLSPTPTDGNAPQFPAGTTFRTEPGFPSRTNSSWFFGDGAALFNEVNAQFASRFNVRFPQLVPLDGMLTSASLRRQGGGSYGFRVERRVTRRLGVEFSFDRSQGRIRVTEAARNAIEATRASFERAFSGLLATIPQTSLQVTSTAETNGSAAGRQNAMTGALTLTLTKHARITTRVLLGAGRVFNAIDPLEARVLGSYEFRFIDTYPVNETDTVTIRFSDRASATVGVFGAGITSDLTGRHGVRADVRVFIGGNGIATSVDASPSARRVGPFVALPSNTNPSIQFSTTTADRSSLGGSTAGLKTFTGSGLDTRIVLSVGYFVRF